MNNKILGIDIGGSGIKGAIVDIKTGKLLTERFRIETPAGGKPQDIINVLIELIEHFKWRGKIGCGFPAVVKSGVICTAANIDNSWVGIDLAKELKHKYKLNATIINDADAAGLAEIKFGAAKNKKGTIIMTTIGTGIGTAVFYNGVLLPNTEFGHLEIKGEIAEFRASDAARKREDLSLKKWSKRLNRYIAELEKLLWPDMIIIGGGIAKKKEKIADLLKAKCELKFAEFGNEAGIIGAALYATNTKL